MRNPTRKNFGFKVSFVILVCGLLTSSLQAAVTWWGVASSGTGNFGTPGNWSTGALPTTADDVLISGTGGKIISSSNATLSAHDLKIESGNYTFTVLSGGGGTGRTLNVNTFSGSALSQTVLTTENAGTLSWILSISGSTSFTGTVQNGSAGAGSVVLLKSGTGFLDVRNATLNQSGITINEGILRVNEASSAKGTLVSGMVRIGSSTTGGILEVDGKNSASTITRTLGTDIAFGSNGASGSTTASWAGFGAVNGDLTVTLNGNAAITWSNTSFFRILALQLGSEGSTHTVKWTNGLNMTDSRTIRAGNGSAAIDGEFSGTLAMTTATGTNAVLTKEGAGTILLSGTSDTFQGRLHVTEGTLLVGGRLGTATNNTTYGIRVDAGATLGGGGAITLSNNAATLFVAGTLKAGEGNANKTLTLSSNFTMEAGSILSFAIQGESLSDNIALTGGSAWSFQTNQLVSILDKGISLEGGLYTLITGLTGYGAYDFSKWQVTSNAPFTGNLVYQGSTLYYEVVPEPSLFALLGLGAGAGLVWKRRKSA